MNHAPITIAGAGIGGLSAALLLARGGQPVRVLEQAGVLAGTGAGIQLGPNAMKVLAHMGLREAVLETACQPQAIAVHDAATGRNITRILLGKAAQALYGETYCTLHRADLQSVLLEAVRANQLIELRLGAALSALHQEIQQDAPQEVQQVKIQLSNDEQLEASVLIGADGLHSKVRALLLQDGAPRATGHAAFRSLLPAADVPAGVSLNEVSVWWGHGVHVVGYPVRGGAWFNLAILARTPMRTPAPEPAKAPAPILAPALAQKLAQSHSADSWNLSATPKEAQRALGVACPQLQALVAAATGWKRWNLFDRPPAPRWSAGAITLLGDAAHPMLPYLAQGAAMALEDAAALAQCFRNHADRDQTNHANIATALSHYEKLRKARTERVVNTARHNGHIFHMRGPMAVARNAVLALKGTEVLGLPWLYGYPSAS